MVSPVRATLALLLGLGLFPLRAQAEPLRSLSPRDRLYDAAGIDGSVFVVGHPGHLLRSRDGGATFESVSAGLNQEALFSVAFNDKGQGAVVGRSGASLVSLDKGATWTASKIKVDDEQPSLFAVDVLDDGAIVAVGEFGAILRSEDHGKTWTRSTYSVEVPSADGQAQADTEGQPAHGEGGAQAGSCPDLAAAEAENEGAIEEARLTDVRFLDATTGFVVGEFGLVLRTDDGGRTFRRQNGCTDKLLFGLAVIGPSRAIAVGAEGTAVETTDGGQTWARRETGTSEHLFGIAADAQRALIVGAAGTALARTDDGPFAPVQTNVHTWLATAWLDDKGQGVIVGGRATLLHTKDGGKTQQRVFRE